LERAWQHALPGREAVARDDVVREWRGLLDAREPAPQIEFFRAGKFDRLRLICRRD
jgi:hypothetical protein